MKTIVQQAILCLCSAAVFGCSGQIGSGKGRSGGHVPTDPTSPLPKVWLEDAAGESPLRRLTSTQLRFAIRDLTGVWVERDRLPFEGSKDGFFTFATLQAIDAGDMEVLRSIAGDVSTAVDVNEIAPCDSGTPQRQCAVDFIESFGSKVFRRAVTEAERSRYAELYDFVDEEDGYAAGVRTILEVMLSSPAFLYRPEADRGSKPTPLSGPELVSRLAFFLWSSVPDSALLAQAEAGDFDDAGSQEQLVRQMLADSRARRSVRYFHEQWLRLSELKTLAPDAEVFPEFHDELGDAFAEETSQYAVHVVFDAMDNTLMELLMGDYSFLNKELGELQSIPTADEFSLTDVSTQPRVGILMQPSTLARLSSPVRGEPIYRGSFLLHDVLCRDLVLPDNLNVMLPEPDPNYTYREQIEAQTSSGECNNCHSRINPLGFGLDAFDALGRYKPQEHGFEIDTAGELVGFGDADGAFEDGPSMMANIANSDVAAECYAEKWFQFALGRARRSDSDQRAFDGIMQSFKASGYDIQALIVAITQSEAFTHRVSE